MTIISVEKLRTFSFSTGSENTGERKLSIIFALGNENSRERKFRMFFAPGSESSPCFRCRERTCSLPGAKVPKSEKAHFPLLVALSRPSSMADYPARPGWVLDHWAGPDFRRMSTDASWMHPNHKLTIITTYPLISIISEYINYSTYIYA